jgi:hypothetical protein
MAKASRRQFLVTISNLSGTFVSKSGGDRSAPIAKAYDGGNPVPDLVSGIPETANLTCGRHFDPNRDGIMLASLRSQVGKFTATINVQPTDSDFVPVGKATIYSGAKLTRVGDVQPDAQSGDMAMFELEFAVASST